MKLVVVNNSIIPKGERLITVFCPAKSLTNSLLIYFYPATSQPKATAITGRTIPH